jgi:hypothetical protein
MAVLFLFPAKPDGLWDEGTLRRLAWKRSQDVWSAVPYAGAEDELELPTFIANSIEPARAPQEARQRSDCTGLWTAIGRAILPGNSAMRGQRHMIALATEAVDGNPDDHLIAAVQASRTSLQVVSSSANPALAEFCRRVNGRFHQVKDNSRIEEAVSLAHLSLLARYEIHYQPVAADATSLKVRVQTPAGWSEATAEL